MGSEQPVRIQTQGMQEGKAVAEGITLVVVEPASGTTALCCYVSYFSQEWPQPILSPSEVVQDSLLSSVKRQEVCSSVYPHITHAAHAGEVRYPSDQTYLSERHQVGHKNPCPSSGTKPLHQRCRRREVQTYTQAKQPAGLLQAGPQQAVLRAAQEPGPIASNSSRGPISRKELILAY